VGFLNPYAKKGARKRKLENGGGSETETSKPKSRRILDVQKRWVERLPGCLVKGSPAGEVEFTDLGGTRGYRTPRQN
jgi:hypothetical protein